jgi:integrase
MDQAGVPSSVAHPHAIKHSRVQHLFEEAEKQGLPPEAALKTVANVVGHKTAQTSWEHYVGETGRGRKVADAVLKKATET